jgi:hypothetical protein
MRVGYKAKHISYLAINWILLCIADPLEQRRFTSIRPPDNENTEVGVPGSESRSFFASTKTEATAKDEVIPARSTVGRLGGVPRPNTFFRRFRNAFNLDSLAVRGAPCSAISIREETKPEVGRPRGFSDGINRHTTSTN